MYNCLSYHGWIHYYCFKIREQVYASPVEKNNLSPLWPETDIDMKGLCDGDFDLPLRLQVYDHERDGNHDIMGFLITSINQLLSADREQGIELRDPPTDSQKMGDIYVEHAELVGGSVDSKKEAQNFMQVVAVALKTRSDAIDKQEEVEALRETVVQATAAALAAQMEAEKKAQELVEAEQTLALAIAAAETAEEAIGGLEPS